MKKGRGLVKQAPIDFFSDMYSVTAGQGECEITFCLSPIPNPTGPVGETTMQGNVRMGHNIAKMLAFHLRTQILAHEREMGGQQPIPPTILNTVGIGIEDWNAFWGGSS